MSTLEFSKKIGEVSVKQSGRRLAEIENSSSERSYALCRLLYVPVLDEFLVRFVVSLWKIAQERMIEIEPWLYKQAVLALHQTLVRRRYLSDTTDSHLARMAELGRDFDNIDFLLRAFPDLWRELESDELPLRRELLLENEFTKDSPQYKTAIFLFRMGWLAISEHSDILPLLVMGRAQASRRVS